MSAGYREEVLKDYQSKRSNRSLSPNLVTSTPASIRDECLLIFAKKRNRKDMNILRLFVDDRESVEDYERALRNVDVGKFKPLRNFLVDPTIQTANKNVELLAWLIGYTTGSHSPEISGSEVKTNNPEITKDNKHFEALTIQELINIGAGSSDINPTHQINDKENGPKSTAKHPATSKLNILIILLLVITGVIWISSTQRASNESILSFLKSDPPCMYWNGYNYVGSECSPSGQTVQFNKFTLNNLKWISCADSINEKHINRIWYIRNNNMVELFTTGGQYPLNVQRRLYPLSQHIYNKYVVTKKVKVECNSKK